MIIYKNLIVQNQVVWYNIIGGKGKQFVNLMAYISIGLIAVALILKKILGVWFDDGSTIIVAVNTISQAIAYTITAIFAFFYAKSKRNIGWMIAYIVFVIAIIAFMILGF